MQIKYNFLIFFIEVQKVKWALKVFLSAVFFSWSRKAYDVDFRSNHTEIGLWTLDRTAHNSVNTFRSCASCVHTHPLHSYKVLYWNLHTDKYTYNVPVLHTSIEKKSAMHRSPLFHFFPSHCTLQNFLTAPCSCAQRHWL